MDEQSSQLFNRTDLARRERRFVNIRSWIILIAASFALVFVLSFQREFRPNIIVLNVYVTAVMLNVISWFTMIQASVASLLRQRWSRSEKFDRYVDDWTYFEEYKDAIRALRREVVYSHIVVLCVGMQMIALAIALLPLSLPLAF